MNAVKSSAAPGPEAAPHPTFAVVRHGGHQYRVTPGDRLVVDRLPSEIGAVVGLEPVLLLSDANGIRVDAASLEGVRVAATVAAHRRGRKIRVFTFKPKKRHRRTLGFRAELTELVVDRVLARGEALPEPVVAEEPEERGGVAEPVDATEPELGAVEAEAAPARRRRPRAAVAQVEESIHVPEAPEPASAAEPPARRRRSGRSPEPAGEPGDGAPAGATDASSAAPVESEVTTARRPRRAPTPAASEPEAAPEPEAASEPATGARVEPEPPPGGTGTRRRRVERRGSSPDAGG